jgi:hypothetical protein
MNDQEAVEKLKDWAKDKEGLDETFAYVLAPDTNRFDEDLKDTIAYDDYDKGSSPVRAILAGIIDGDHMYDVIRENLPGSWSGLSWGDWFRLSSEAYEFITAMICELDKGTDG